MHNNPSISRTNSFYGGALNLEGGIARTAPYIALDGGITLGGKDLTIDFWCYADSSLDSTYDFLSDFFGFFNYNSVNTSYTFWLAREAGTVKCNFNGSDYLATFNIPLDTLFHFAIVYTHSDSTWRFFINGLIVATGTKKFPATTYNNFRIGVANYFTNSRLGFKGTIDEFRLFDGVALWTEDFPLPTVSDYLDYIDYEGYSAFPLALRFDTEKHVNKSVQLQLDTLRDLPLILKLDAKRDIQKSVAPFLDTSRKLENNFAFSFDTIRKNALPVQFHLDTLRDLPLIFRLDTERRIKNVVAFNLDTSRFSGNVLDFQADLDTSRRTINAIDFSADTKLQIIQSVELELDAERIVERTVKFGCDIIRKLPYPFIIEPTYNLLPIDTPVTAGIQSLGINIVAGALVDQLNFVTVNYIGVLEQIRGQFLDYKFNFRVERITMQDNATDLPISTCNCCADIDGLLYTPMAYQLPQSQYNGGLGFYFTTSSSTNTDSAEVSDSKSTQTVEEPKCKASVHAIKIASILGKIPILLFDDFVSTADTSPRGVTYRDLIDEIFLWTSRIPHKMINVFLRDDKLFFIQRGHEQNTFDLLALNADIGKDFTVERSLIRTQWGTNATTQKKSVPVLGYEMADDKGEDGGQPLLRQVRTVQDGYGNEVGLLHRYSNCAQWATGMVYGIPLGYIVTDVYYEYDGDGDVTKTTTNTNTKGGSVYSDDQTGNRVVVINEYHHHNGEKFLFAETTETYEGGTLVESKTVHHAPSGAGQQHNFSVDEDGNVNGSTTTASRRTETPTAYELSKNKFNWSERARLLRGEYKVEDDGETYWGDGAGAYVWKDGKKYEVVGWKNVSEDIEDVPANSLYDDSFPVADETLKYILTKEMQWLNYKIQETVSLDVYGFPHIFDFNDRIIFFGNIYFLQSNSVTHHHNLPNKQSLQLIRWYGFDGSTPAYGFGSQQIWTLIEKIIS